MKTLLKKLIQADTTVGRGEIEAAKIIALEFSHFGVKAKLDCWNTNRANVIAEIKSSGEKPGLLFLCHLDVVPPGEVKWNYPPFSATESADKIYGRGAADMKGGIAATITAIKELVDTGVKLKGNIVFLATAGEETDSCGVKRFIKRCSKSLPELAGIIIPEPTDFEIVTAHRGLLWLEVTTFGKTAHGSTPHLGINAISSMRMVLQALDSYKIPSRRHSKLGECSMSVNTINGGKAINVVPDKCTTGIDIRTLPSQNHKQLIRDIQKILVVLKQKDSQFDAAISVVRDVSALQTDDNCDFVKEFCKTVKISWTTTAGFCTDGSHISSLNIPVIIFGPGRPNVCHKPNEYIRPADVEKAVKYFKNIILKFLT